jgi:hypothetical protein
MLKNTFVFGVSKVQTASFFRVIPTRKTAYLEVNGMDHFLSASHLLHEAESFLSS